MLTENALGKVGGVQVSREPLIRQWDVLQSTPEAAFVLRRTRLGSVAEDNAAFQWQRTFSRVDGALPLDSLPRLPLRVPFKRQPAQFVVLRFELELSEAGPVQLQLNSADGLSLWVGSAPLKADTNVQFEAAAGNHRVTIAVDQTVRTESLVVKLGELTDLNRVRLPGAKSEPK